LGLALFVIVLVVVATFDLDAVVVEVVVVVVVVEASVTRCHAGGIVEPPHPSFHVLDEVVVVVQRVLVPVGKL
jgi:hypothetical protein